MFVIVEHTTVATRPFALLIRLPILGHLAHPTGIQRPTTILSPHLYSTGARP